MSEDPMREKRRSIRPISEKVAGIKEPVCANRDNRAMERR